MEQLIAGGINTRTGIRGAKGNYFLPFRKYNRADTDVIGHSTDIFISAASLKYLGYELIK